MKGVFATATAVAVWGLALGVLAWGSGVDMALTMWLHDNYHQGTNTVMRVLGEVGKGSFQASVCVLVGLVLWVRQRVTGYGLWEYRVWLWCVPVFLAAGAVGIVLKMCVGRLRPKEVLWNGGDAYSWNPWMMDAGFWSFPSGHAISTFAIATVLVVGYPRWSKVIWSVAVVLAASRFLAITPHYLGDVVAGTGVGMAVALVGVHVLQRRKWL